MFDLIKNEVEQRGITRLCHFTPSRNLIHIASSDVGVLATKQLKEDERQIFSPTDLMRLDGHEGHISCSVEYPNAWYFDIARAKDTLFRDWVVLLISPEFLWIPGTLFCPRNAGVGRGIVEGYEGFSAMYENGIVGTSGRTFIRGSKHLLCSPTDDQAEVMVPDRITLDYIIAIVVRDEAQAKNEMARFRLANVQENRFEFIIAPDLFNKRALSRMIRNGQRPKETPLSGDVDND